MPSLADITPLSVDVAGVPVTGLSGRGLGSLIANFPELQKILTERTVEPKRLMEIAPDAVAAIIAAGIGKPGDKKEEAKADTLPIGTQLEFLAAIVKVSFPNGLSAAVEMVTSLAKALPDVDVPDTTAPASN